MDIMTKESVKELSCGTILSLVKEIYKNAPNTYEIVEMFFTAWLEFIKDEDTKSWQESWKEFTQSKKFPIVL